MPTPQLNEAKAHLSQEGWCVVPDVIPRKTAAELTKRLWALVEENAREGYSCLLPDLDPNERMARILNPVPSDARFRALVEHDVAVEMARAAIGGDIILANCTANIARPGARSMALHSDLAFILPEPWLYPWSANVVWCLTDVHRDNGATLYVPGSHRWRTSSDVPPDAPDRLVPFEAGAGSIIVMDGRLWHTSGANITADKDRALLFGYYSASFLRPMINWTAVIAPEERGSYSPRLRQLLGFDVFANTSEGEREGQGDWRGRPVGAEQALAEFRQVAGQRAETAP
jgi:ectoine hydroxylase-related dioxygenase (phytanoyl-CoA dioxygenase family)